MAWVEAYSPKVIARLWSRKIPTASDPVITRDTSGQKIGEAGIAVAIQTLSLRVARNTTNKRRHTMPA
ncbi:MAG TPA: hypothetical protein VJH63_01880 [Candidatus Paceibacterota bacterium]